MSDMDLQADIEATRADLAATVDQLAARLDVKARVQERLRRLDPVRVAFVGAAVAGALVTVVVLRRRGRA